MKNHSIRTRLLAMLLAAVMVLGLSACSGQSTSSIDTSVPDIADTGTLPEVYGYTRGNGGTSSSSSGYGVPRGNSGTTDPEDTLKRYGEIETLTKSVKTPTAPDTKNTKLDNSYGTVDWSTAANGYITFTAKGQIRVFIIQDPDGTKASFTVNKGESIMVALTGGVGEYQYTICNLINNGTAYSVLYKNSFTVKALDAELVPYLVSTPYGDYANAPKATAQAEELWDSSKTQLENVQAIAKWVNSLKYDTSLLQGNLSVYVNPDSVIENGGGVCNEFSKLLVAMLRSQGVPAYRQSGLNASGGNHAWVMAWVELSTSTKSGVTSSKGAWVLIEAVEGLAQIKGSAERNYTIPEGGDYAN